ncbi:MAG: Bax inhibitor-1/YccA family protein [Alphaproteobacteria bacterium]|nr:Bax inhibitor-1/YccA family protein [Alphaproteobacteria bacterium]
MDNQYGSYLSQSTAARYDAGLRAHMQRVYNIMAAGLVVTGLVAYVTAATPDFFQAIHGTWLGLIVALSPLGIIFFGLNPVSVQRMSAGAVNGLYYLLTGLIGLSLSYIFYAYSGESLARVFFITAGMFAATSIYGYTTKKDLTGMGGFMMMGLFGILIAMIVNIFLQSTALMYTISVIGVIVFTGLIAWDTQRIKEIYSATHTQDDSSKIAVLSALSLYLNFINLFQFLLQLLGDRR